MYSVSSRMVSISNQHERVCSTILAINKTQVIVILYTYIFVVFYLAHLITQLNPQSCSVAQLVTCMSHNCTSLLLLDNTRIHDPLCWDSHDSTHDLATCPYAYHVQRRLDKVSYIIEEFLELGNKTWPVSLCSEEMSVPNLCPVRKSTVGYL